MPRFRKKPVVIEARQLQGNAHDIHDLARWCEGRVQLDASPDERSIIPTIAIPTLEGVMKASVGDWIIKGVNGEFYPCKSDIFGKTYEPE